MDPHEIENGGGHVPAFAQAAELKRVEIGQTLSQGEDARCRWRQSGVCTSRRSLAPAPPHFYQSTDKTQHPTRQVPTTLPTAGRDLNFQLTPRQ